MVCKVLLVSMVCKGASTLSLYHSLCMYVVGVGNANLVSYALVLEEEV